MKKINFNKNWEFTFENDLDAYNTFGFDKYSDASGAATRFYDYNNWEKIDLPHDWAVALPKDLRANTFAGARANTSFHRFMTERKSIVENIYNIGWYRKEFFFDPAWAGKRVFIEFEGIFRDACVWINGAYMDRHTSGYTSFIIEMTDHILEGEINSVAVRVDSDQPEGWWYEGSGIYRNVNIIVGEPVYFKYNETVVKTQNDGTVSCDALIVNDTELRVSQTVEWKVIDGNGDIFASAKTSISLEAYSEKKISTSLNVEDPALWSVDQPNLYTLRIIAGDEVAEERFGFRTVTFDADKGFFLNGKPLKIHGACVHQDFGGVGVALSDNLNYYKIQRLKEMGVNAYRCSHHAPSPALLRACDELGMLVMDETRMFGTSNEAVRQLTDLIKRDRNHPSVFIWSLGNEEFSVQNLEWSGRLMKKMTRIAKALDDTRPVTYGGNNGRKYQGVNSESEIRGINYIYNGNGAWTDQYHADHPQQPMIGTEESSYVLSRGGAIIDLGSGLLDSTGSVTMSWGSTPKGWVKYFEDRPYLAGSFMWTGFDYRGEPNPFITSYVASSFGTIDLCGMEKPPFYYYKAWWTEEPVLKLTPHWNHKKGETVDLAVFTNCEEITLFVNGKRIDSKKVERFDAPMFSVPYEEGCVSVEGIRDGRLYKDTLYTSGKTVEVRYVKVLDAKDEADIAIYELTAYDKNGLLNPLAADTVEITVDGGKLVGVGNGDPANLDYEQKPAEEEVVYLRTFNYEKGMYSVPLKSPNMLWRRYDMIKKSDTCEGFCDDRRIYATYKGNLEDPKTYTFTTRVRDVEKYEYVEFERLGGKATVYLNGEEIGNNLRSHSRMPVNNVRSYRFYCTFAEGENEIKVILEQDELAALPISGSVKIGRRIENTPWNVRLHYGLARVFVKSSDPKNVKLNIKLK